MNTRRSRAEWRQLLSRQGQSGLSLAEFSRREGINAQSLNWWRWKLRLEGQAQPVVDAPRFLEINVAGLSESEPSVGFEIALPGEVLIRVPHGFDATELQGLLRVVRSSC